VSSLLSSLSRPFIASFEITSKCDLECAFCSARLPEHRVNDLPTADALEIVSRLAEESILTIFLTGGEPLLHHDLPLIIEKCRQHGMNTLVSTNGTHATRDLAMTLASVGLDEIQISIHAPNEVHDTMVHSSGALEKSLVGLRNLVTAGLKVTVAAVPTRSNYMLLPDLAQIVAGMGALHFRMLRLMPHSHDLLRDVVPDREMEELVDRLTALRQTLKGFEITVHASPGLSKERYYDPKEHKICHTCTAGKMSMGILSNGDCVPCLELKGREFLCGNMLTNSISEMWDSPPMRRMRSITPDAYRDTCGECQWKWTCYSARCVAYNLCGDILAEDRSCYKLLADAG
jgi:radical SAM protein with 4Fe4S-binding SPASM domain